MKILMSNDDGVVSEGIIYLAERLADIGHEVLVCAPKFNQSAMSHSITMRKEYFAEKLTFSDRKATYYAVDGKPIDCVQFGLSYLKFQPDLVIGGINDDKNLGRDSIYSGTVGIASEGAVCGYPAWGVSVYYGLKKRTDRKEMDFQTVIDRLLERFDYLYKITPKGGFLNINIPMFMECKGIKFCPLAKSEYDMTIEKVGENKYQLLGIPIHYDRAEKGTDIYYVMQGYMTITPLTYEMTDFSALEKLQ